MEQEQSIYPGMPVKKFSFHQLEYEAEADHELLCPICMEPMVDPIITTPCQHVFCTSCLRDTFYHQDIQDIANHCPKCRTEFVLTNSDGDAEAVYTEPLSGHIDYDIPNRLHTLRAKCPNEGCEAVRERFLLPDHVQNHCPHTVFPCYVPTCERVVERRHMGLHCTHELVECRLCHELIGPHQSSAHEEECPELESLCPRCGESVRRDQLKSHREQCQQPNLVCQGHDFGCQFISESATQLTEHQAGCTIFRLSETIQRQDKLLQSHRDALLTLTRRNEELESSVTKLEHDLQMQKKETDKETRLDEMERKLEAHQQQLTERVSKSELSSLNSVQHQMHFNQYIEACLARLQTDVGGIHHNLIRGRMHPIPHPMPMQNAVGDRNVRPGSEGSESASRQMPANDDLMPGLTRTMSATEPSPSAAVGTGANPVTGVFASLASLLPNSTTSAQTSSGQPNQIPGLRSQPMARRRSSEERPVKL